MIAEIRKLTNKDAAEAAILITENIAYADEQAKAVYGPDALAFPGGLARQWTERDVLAMEQYLDTSWGYFEDDRLMAVIYGTMETRRGAPWYRVIIGAIRISAIKPEEHVAYLTKPLTVALPDARDRFGSQGGHAVYPPEHVRMEAYVQGFQRAKDGEQVTYDRGDGMREVFLPFLEAKDEADFAQITAVLDRAAAQRERAGR